MGYMSLLRNGQPESTDIWHNGHMELHLIRIFTGTCFVQDYLLISLDDPGASGAGLPPSDPAALAAPGPVSSSVSSESER